MLEILEKYPIAFSEFFEYAGANYGISPEIFSREDEDSQALTIISWFGYPQTLPDNRNDTVLYLHQILSDFDKAARRYPDKRDLIKEISKMDEKEKIQKHPEIFNQRLEPTILPSLKDAFNFHLIPKHIQEQIEHDQFWTGITTWENDPIPF